MPPMADVDHKRSTEHYALLVVAAVTVVAAFGLALFLPPDARGFGTHELLGLDPCLPMERWNFPCPGCGVTTAVTHAARGEFAASLRTQPFGFVLALAAAAFALWAPIAHLRGRDLWLDLTGWFRPRLVAWIGALLVLGWAYKIWVVRS